MSFSERNALFKIKTTYLHMYYYFNNCSWPCELTKWKTDVLESVQRRHCYANPCAPHPPNTMLAQCCINVRRCVNIDDHVAQQIPVLCFGQWSCGGRATHWILRCHLSNSLNVKGCICHFVMSQIHPFMIKLMILSWHLANKATVGKLEQHKTKVLPTLLCSEQ